MSSWGLSFAVSACGGEPQSHAGRTASPAGHARPHSWPWTAYTCDTGLEGAHQHIASHATGGTSRVMVLGPLGGYCGGTFCRGGRLHRPSL